MKIAVSAEGKTIVNLLDMRFGRCEYFQIHDTEGGEIKTKAKMLVVEQVFLHLIN